MRDEEVNDVAAPEKFSKLAINTGSGEFHEQGIAGLFHESFEERLRDFCDFIMRGEGFSQRHGNAQGGGNGFLARAAEDTDQLINQFGTVGRVNTESVPDFVLESRI